MDDHRFDDLARALAGPVSRRAFARLLGAGAAGGLLAALGGAPATAKEKPPREDKPPKEKSEDKEKDKIKLEKCRRQADCRHPGQTCVNGYCGCPPGLTLCPGEGCVDLMTEHDSCGSCANLCPGDLQCAGGECACPAGLTRCDVWGYGECVDVSTSVESCGACGQSCTGGSCAGGQCVCPAGQVPCYNQEWSPPGSVCCDAAKCRAGVCQAECPDGHPPCGETCCDPGVCQRCLDGACRDCPEPTTCNPSGEADPCVCPVGRERCAAGCCQEGELCADGACLPACFDPCLHVVDGACAPICEDPCAPCDGVGACVPLECGPDLICGDGACVCAPVSCPDGLAQDPETCACVCPDRMDECAGACVDTATDPANCGTCGVMCTVGEVCEGGTCAPVCGPASCPEGQTQNPETCACECTGFQDGCAPHEICEAGACRAVCLDTSGGGVHNGTFVACADANGDLAGCSCNTCGTTCRHSQGYACCSDGCQYVVTTCAGMGH